MTKRMLDRNAIKYIVIIAMTIDHIAWGFVDQTNPILGGIMHLFGRLTGPTMAYFLAEGYHFTSSRDRYQFRLFLFALISWVPFDLFEFGTVTLKQSVIYTLFLGFTAMRVWDCVKLNRPVRWILIVLLTIASMPGDWPVMDVLAPLFLHIFRYDRMRRRVALTLVYLWFPVLQVLQNPMTGWFQFGIVLVPLLLAGFYNGKPGKKSAFNKWFFYIYYPAHLLVLAALRWCA